MRQNLITKLNPNSQLHEILRKKYGEAGALQWLNTYQVNPYIFTKKFISAVNKYGRERQTSVAPVQSQLGRRRTWSQRA